MPHCRVVILASLLLLPALPAQFPALDYEATGRSLRMAISQSFGIHATGSDWIARRQIAEAFDFIWAPLNDPTSGLIHYHPFLYPELACFTRAFYMQSMDEMLAVMDAATPTASGIRTYYLNSSAFVIEAFFPSGPAGALRPFRVAVDFSDVVFDTSGTFNPGCIDDATYLQRIGALADRLDCQFISHLHPDHFSLRMIGALVARGKTTFVPPSVVALLQILGLPTTGFVALATGTQTHSPWFSSNVFEGAQLGFPNNVYFLNFNVPVTPGAANDGVTFCHFGDNDVVPQLEAHVLTLAASGYFRAHVLTANCSSLSPAILGILHPEVRFLSPCYEFFHFVGGGWFGMDMPGEGMIVPELRYPQFWGESTHYPFDFLP